MSVSAQLAVDTTLDSVSQYEEDFDFLPYLVELEQRLLPKPSSAKLHDHIEPRWRSMLVDWIIKVHESFRLLPETLFICINYLDRFLSGQAVPPERLQLVAATAVFVAAKYEEVEPLSIKQVVFITAGAYSARTIRRAEKVMLSALNFELGWPGPLIFLQKLSRSDSINAHVISVAQYLVEAALMQECFVRTLPSLLAASSYLLARMILNVEPWVSVYTSNSLEANERS